MLTIAATTQAIAQPRRSRKPGALRGAARDDVGFENGGSELGGYPLRVTRSFLASEIDSGVIGIGEGIVME